MNDKYKKSKAFGTFPADGFFGFGDYKNYDGILAMYHDQGLIPLKLLANGGGVNFTANLKIVRVSPDHGTGFAIAGKGIASEQSTLEAIVAGIDIVNNRINFKN
jgi:4-hydroxythreonine-4-phosphate dehydrogenase